MNGMELPLVVFTVLSQTAVGIVLASLLGRYAAAGPETDPGRPWGAAAGILLVGLLASLAHLGHPTGAVNAVKHLATSWLSREVLVTSIFLAILLLGLPLMRRKSPGWLLWLAAAAGIVSLVFMGMTYSPPSFPAVNNLLPTVFFVLTAAVLGPAVVSWFVRGSTPPVLVAVLGSVLLLALVIYLIVPCIWLSGGTVMQNTGWAWIGSPLYWLRIVLGLALPLAVVWKTRDIPVWLPLLLIAGELLGRAVFFSQTLHTAGNIGGLY